MTENDIRSKRLEWIRDGSNWLVGFAAGALVLSGTYYYERFNSSPHAAVFLIIAWISLTVCILVGVMTSFASWKDLRTSTAGQPEAALGPWVARCYTAMMWSFLIGYLSLATVMITNVWSATPKNNPAEIVPFAFSLRLPPFESGSAELSPDLSIALSSLAKHLAADKEITSVVVVGRADRQELGAELKRKYATNFHLARQRGANLKQVLGKLGVAPSKITVTSAGPLLTSKDVSGNQIECDRAASVFIAGIGSSHPWTGQIAPQLLFQCDG